MEADDLRGLLRVRNSRPQNRINQHLRVDNLKNGLSIFLSRCKNLEETYKYDEYNLEEMHKMPYI